MSTSIDLVELEAVLRTVAQSDIAYLKSSSASGWKHVTWDKKHYVGRSAHKKVTQGWNDPMLCAVELFLQANPTHPTARRYFELTLPQTGAQSVLPVVHKDQTLQDTPKVSQENSLQAKIQTALAAGDLKAVLRLQQEIDMLGANAESQAYTTNAMAQDHTEPADKTKFKHHEYATMKARDAYIDALSGNATYHTERFPMLRMSCDFAVLQGLMTYWYHYIVTNVGSIENPWTNRITLEHPKVADEIKKLLIQGIPCDFLFFEEDRTRPLFNTQDPNNLPLTGLVCTPFEAAYLSLMRAPTWLDPKWLPYGAGGVRPEDDPGPLADLFLGYDPHLSQERGEPTHLSIPNHLLNERYPVLTVPEAFLTWGLACARAVGQVKPDAIPYLGVQDAVERVYYYTNGGVDRVFGQNAQITSWRGIMSHYQMRRDMGDPEDEILEDLGPPPSRPHVTVDWRTNLVQLKGAAIKIAPKLVAWATMAHRVHDQAHLTRFKLLEEIHYLPPG